MPHAAGGAVPFCPVESPEFSFILSGPQTKMPFAHSVGEDAFEGATWLDEVVVGLFTGDVAVVRVSSLIIAELTLHKSRPL